MYIDSPQYYGDTHSWDYDHNSIHCSESIQHKQTQITTVCLKAAEDIIMLTYSQLVATCRKLELILAPIPNSALQSKIAVCSF